MKKQINEITENLEKKISSISVSAVSPQNYTKRNFHNSHQNPRNKHQGHSRQTIRIRTRHTTDSSNQEISTYSLDLDQPFLSNLITKILLRRFMHNLGNSRDQKCKGKLIIYAVVVMHLITGGNTVLIGIPYAPFMDTKGT